MPNDLISCSPVQAKAEGWFVFPHLPSDIVTASQLIAEAVARGVQHNAAHTAQRLSRQELHLGIWVIGLHQTSRMHLDPFKVDGGSSNGLSHLDSIACAMLSVGGGQVQQVGAVRGQQGVGPKVRAEAARGQNHGAKLLHHLSSLSVLTSHHIAAVLEQFEDLSLRNDPGTVGLLRHLLQHLDQGIGDGHSRETLLATVGAGSGMSTQSGQQRHVKIELVHQPVHIRSTVATEHFHQLRLLGATLQGVGGEELDGVLHLLGLLRLRLSTVDAAGGLG
mmetsp:Transcript_35759/g.77247  ORF Transcript_35759/g.77247 Transcript_35759/m.77247 type:complete len:277 (+) Transcript_35759:266-1096(+)